MIIKVTTLALALTLAAPSIAKAQDLGRDSDTWTWDGRVANGNWFRLNNVNGPVTIEPSSDNQIHVRAEKEVRRGKASDVAFRVVQMGGDVRVCAVGPRDICDEEGLHSRRNDDDYEDRDDRRDVRVRFIVKVPAGVRVSAGTVNGEMRVRDLSSDVRASTVNGRVEVRNVGGEVKATTVNGQVNVTTRSGPVNASTVNGDIDVSMSSVPRDGEMSFHTVNGSVTVETPSSLDANVSLDTMHGSISSDYPVQLSGKFGPRHAEGVVGRGGRSIRLRTLNGSVELRKAR
ncbi:MAG: DUF4097 family beta strand repeat-containing protein [Gemmatimonadales bacterium]